MNAAKKLQFKTQHFQQSCLLSSSGVIKTLDQTIPYCPPGAGSYYGARLALTIGFKEESKPIRFFAIAGVPAEKP